MYPILINMGKITIYTYGFFVAVGFFTAIFFARCQAERIGENSEQILDLSFFILIGAILGARLLYVFTNFNLFVKNPIEIFKIWNGGLVFYGGFIAALITAVVYIKKRSMNMWKTADILAPSIAIGHAIGRIGCFAAGCCYGKTCNLPWAVTFNHAQSLAPTGISLHPTQLYSSLANFLIFLFLICFRTWFQKFEGQLFWLYVMVYGIVRSIIEIFRGDFRGVLIFNIFSISQFIGLTVSLFAVFMLFFLSSKNKKYNN